MLTLEDLKQYEHGIFAFGCIKVAIMDYGPKWLKWVAVRGQIHDWAIYAVENSEYELELWGWQRIAETGDKIHTRSIVSELVACDKEALSWYRD